MKELALHGQWQMTVINKEEKIGWMKEPTLVTVPGTVLSGLLAEGKIEDPFFGRNEDKTRELFQHDYLFEYGFEVSEGLYEEEEILLCCEGLDTLATIRVNGMLLDQTNNMHRRYEWSVKSYLAKGENQISILFASPLAFIKQYEYEPNKEVTYEPVGGMAGNHLIRKTHSMFGWDWGPQLIDAGIWRKIALIGYSKNRILDVYVRQEHKEQEVELTVDVQLAQFPDEDLLLEVSIQEKGKEISELKEPIASVTVLAKNSEMKVDEDGSIHLIKNIQLTEPKLWWPSGYGEQTLYVVNVGLKQQHALENDYKEHIHAQEATIDKKELTIGLRTLKISREKDQYGEEFAFVINGVKIFTMGGNYIPEDNLFTRITLEKQRQLLLDCKRAGFNCIRIWGGGYYPSNEFYQICDELGLIVWQDLMFACNVYDVTKDFAKNCRLEAIDNVKRLRNHPCLGLWCGNNEMESAWCNWADFKKETPYLKADYLKLFEDILPNVVKETNPDTFYWPSSPSSGGCFDDPDADNRGDRHYWDVWHGLKPFTDYANYQFRFCSEFGFQSFPSIKTIEAFTDAADRNIFSRVMESHQKNDGANGKILYYLSENFRYPCDFDSLLYVSQLLQGLAMKYGVDHWRRNRGISMGALYWQINDIWPGPSWSSIDYFGRWKALHYFAKRFYGLVTISIEKEQDQFHGWIENETKTVLSGTFVCTVKNMNCDVLKTEEIEVLVEPFSSQKILTLQIESILEERLISNMVERKSDCLKEELFVEIEYTTNDGEYYHEVETLLPYKYVSLKNPQIKTQVEEVKEGYEIKLWGNYFAPFVELEVKDADVIFSDNYLFLTKSTESCVYLMKKDIRNGEISGKQDLQNRLIVRSLIDSYV